MKDDGLDKIVRPAPLGLNHVFGGSDALNIVELVNEIQRLNDELDDVLETFSPDLLEREECKMDDKGAFEYMKLLMDQLLLEKPMDRSDKDRAYAVAITELQKLMAWYKTYCFGEPKIEP
jgi:dTDP-D-glucose 4,6-dehydratase